MNADTLHYRANRAVLFAGTTYAPGDRIPVADARQHRTLQAMLRQGHVTLHEVSSTGLAVVDGRRRDGGWGPPALRLVGRFKRQAAS
jgi:hypothetical protein